MDLHLVNCSPRCSKCYYLYQCRDFSEQQSLLSNILATQSCQCRASNPQLFWDDSTSDSLSIQEFECARTLCGDCGRGMARTSDGDALSAARIKMLEKRLRRMNNEMDTCAHCRQTLKPGPRWWVCKSCTKECGDAVHVQWAGGNRWQLLKWRAMRNSKATAVEQDAAPPAQAE